MPDKVHSLILPKRLPTSWAGHVAQKEEIRNAYKIVVEKPQGKRTFVRPRHKWEVKVKLSLYIFLTEHYAMKAYWGSGRITPLIP
jgi:hypothetical protein